MDEKSSPLFPIGRGVRGWEAVVIEWLVHYNFAYHIFIEDNMPLHCDYADMFHVYIK